MTQGLFQSFWMGGYEGADHVNGAGQSLDLSGATGHVDRLAEDYRRARRLGLRTVRESIGWRLSEGAGGALDLGRAVRIAQAARAAGMQPLWTLMHYGLPPDLTLEDDALVERFARFAGAVARALVPLCPGPRIYTPINEISFLTWAGTATGMLGSAGLSEARRAALGEQGVVAAGYAIKCRLVRAALAGMAAIRAADPGARFLHVEPVVHVEAPWDRPDLAELAARLRGYQWQALDLLGEQSGGLDCVGLNHYHSSQWEVHTGARLEWHLRDARRQPLSQLLGEAWQRYRRPLLLAETGHVGAGRAAWLHEAAGEVLRARARGVPVQGICLYPLLDRPDWDQPDVWHRCGLWHVEGRADMSWVGAGPPTPPLPRSPEQPPQRRAKPLHGLSRHVVTPYAAALREWPGLPSPPAGRLRRVVLLLPVAWEVMDAGLQARLRVLSARMALCLVEPPRAAPTAPQCRRHTLGPAMELLVLQGRQLDGGWAGAPPPEALARLREAVAVERWDGDGELEACLEDGQEEAIGPVPGERSRALPWLLHWELDAGRAKQTQQSPPAIHADWLASLLSPFGSDAHQRSASALPSAAPRHARWPA